MKSVIYTGFVEHTRYLPVYHQLRYSLYVYGIDLDELTALDQKLPLFGYNRFRPAAVHDRDYLDYGPGRIKDKLMARLEAEGLAGAVRRVVLITSPRYFDYVFNPVSFYYCLSESGEPAAVVAEVNNTFGERHVYIPTPDTAQDARQTGYYRFTADKAFFVSPFNTMEGEYEFFFSPLQQDPASHPDNPPDSDLDIRINLLRNGETAFKARLTGRPMPLTGMGQFKTLLRHPLTPHLTMLRILKEAAKLRLNKKLPFQEKPRPMHSMTIRPYPDRLIKKVPKTVGLVGDKLQPCLQRPNCVNSMASKKSRAHIPPIAYNSSAETARERLLEVLYAYPGLFPVSLRSHYIHAVCETRILGFKDDLEFLIDDAAKQIHCRSASRVGYSDLGVNRRRVERIRERFLWKVKGG